MFCDKITPELSAAMEEFERRFDDIVPLEMIGGTTEELIQNLQKCFAENKNILSRLYGLELDGDIIY